jgi:hypothetical protein
VPITPGSIGRRGRDGQSGQTRRSSFRRVLETVASDTGVGDLNYSKRLSWLYDSLAPNSALAPKGPMSRTPLQSGRRVMLAVSAATWRRQANIGNPQDTGSGLGYSLPIPKSLLGSWLFIRSAWYSVSGCNPDLASVNRRSSPGKRSWLEVSSASVLVSDAARGAGSTPWRTCRVMATSA